MMSDIQPHFCPLPLADINRKPIFTGLNSFCSIREMVIIINFSADNMMISVWPHFSCPLVGINKRLILPELNSPSSAGVTTTPFSVSTPSRPFPFSANANEDLTYLSDINTPFICFRVENRLAQSHFKEELNAPSISTQSSSLKSPTDKDDKTKTLLCPTPVALVKNYVF